VQKDESIEIQVAECNTYAKANNLNVVATYADRALTGKTDKRPEFQKMMRHAERRQFDVVIAYKSNRMGRNMLQALLNEQKLSDYGIRCVYTKEDFGDTAAGRFALRNMMNVSQFYSENMAEDIKIGLLNNAEKCMIANGSIPMGYVKGEDGKFALDPPKAAIIREAFERVDSGEPFVDIARDFNSRGLKTKRGSIWHKNSFQHMIVNERYTGVYIYDTVRIEGGVPQIVDKELFLRVQERLKTKKNPRGRHREYGEYLLTGKLFCGKCGSPMVGQSGTSKLGKLYYYYICNSKADNNACGKKRVRRDWCEREIAEALKYMLSDDKMLNRMADTVIEFGKQYRARSDIAILEQQLKAIDKSLSNMASAIEQGIITETTKDRLLELEKEKRRVQNQLLLERADIFDVSKEKLLLWYGSFRHGDINNKDYQRGLIDNILVSAYVYDDHFKIDINASGDKRKIKAHFKFIDSIENTEGEGVRIKKDSVHQPVP
jgi:DNA invertase Pin-like site-specific DNA recombinase